MPAFLFPLLGLAALGAAAAFAGKQKGIQPTGASPPSPPPGLPPLPGMPTMPGTPTQPGTPTVPGTLPKMPGAAIDTTWDDGLNQPWAAPIKDYAKSLLANSTNTTDLETYAYYCYYWGFPKAAAMLIARANTLHQQRGEPNTPYPPPTPLTPGQSTVPLPTPPAGAPPVVAPPTASFPSSLPVPATVPGTSLPTPSMPLPSMPLPSVPQPSYPQPVPTGVYPTTRTYTAVKGDTGSSIALKFTGNAGRWTELRDANPGTAHAQYGMAFQPGRVLTLPASWPGGAGTATMPTPSSPVPGMPTMPVPTPVSFPGSPPMVAVPGTSIGLPVGAWILPDGRLAYVIQSGDYGAKIAGRFGKKEADVPSMVALNPGFPWSKGVPGMEVLLPPAWWTGPRTPTVRPTPPAPVGSTTLTPKG